MTQDKYPIPESTPALDADLLAVAEEGMEVIKHLYDDILPYWRKYEELYSLVHQQPRVPYRFEKSTADGFRKTKILDFDSNGVLSISEERVPVDFADKPETTEQLQYIVQPDGFAVKFEEDEYGVPQAQVVDVEMLGMILEYATQGLSYDNKELNKKCQAKLLDERDRAYALERAKKIRKFHTRAAVGFVAWIGLSTGLATAINNDVVSDLQTTGLEQEQIADDSRRAFDSYLQSLGSDCAETVAKFLSGQTGQSLENAEAETVIASYKTCVGEIIPVTEARSLEKDYQRAERISKEALEGASDKRSTSHRFATTLPVVVVAALAYACGWGARYDRKFGYYRY